MLKTFDEIKRLAVNTLELEADAVQNIANFIDDGFASAVQFIYQLEGRVVVTGVGKSANIAKKIVATLNSTGTPAVFMHGADAIHGDLGNVQKEDAVICISKSGNTPEIKALVPLVKGLGNKLIGLVGNLDSYLAQQSDYLLNATVEREACPNNLAPTTSTTAQLALGDALAVCLMDYRGFSSEDFARYHPGGALGKKLYLKMGDLLDHSSMPQVRKGDPLSRVILEISSKRKGATAVVEEGQLLGVITDGDLRRMLEKEGSLEDLKAQDIMNSTPKVIESDQLAVKGFGVMEQFNISQLLVTEHGKYAGVVHLHDILKEGIY